MEADKRGECELQPSYSMLCGIAIFSNRITCSIEEKKAIEIVFPVRISEEFCLSLSECKQR